jgi:transcription initiation factor TFIIIB Brf1 subunit/transcription initiation factor TFIIB
MVPVSLSKLSEIAHLRRVSKRSFVRCSRNLFLESRIVNISPAGYTTRNYLARFKEQFSSTLGLSISPYNLQG